MTKHETVLTEAERSEIALKGRRGGLSVENTIALAERAILAKQAAQVEPVAWGLFARVNGEWHLQHPVRYSIEDAEGDKRLYEEGLELMVRALYTTPPITSAQVEPVAAIAMRQADDTIDQLRGELRISETARTEKALKAVSDFGQLQDALDTIDAQRKLLGQARDALAEELAAWDIDPPLAHVKDAHDAITEHLKAHP